MDITALSTILSYQNTNNDISILMLSKSLDLIDTMGEGMKKIMEQSVLPHLGNTIDISL